MNVVRAGTLGWMPWTYTDLVSTLPFARPHFLWSRDENLRPEKYYRAQNLPKNRFNLNVVSVYQTIHTKRNHFPGYPRETFIMLTVMDYMTEIKVVTKKKTKYVL